MRDYFCFGIRPVPRIQMKFVFFWLILSILLSFSSVVLSQPKLGSGCLVTNGSYYTSSAPNSYYRIYNYMGGQSPTNYGDWASSSPGTTNWTTSGNANLRANGDSRAYKCTFLTPTGGSCTVTTNLSPNVTNTGTAVTITGSSAPSSVACPIDDYTWLILSSLGVICFFRIRCVQ
ncbi:hypothetical protein [Pedobacter sp. Leaf250]|uniref:hypothetical protein n=1 Tax=Pedobacter sp. Leaf250 TaxID=2876559 RepID=UPI001E4F8591|nr:hypothetical protein [Pedobacter sp. Leaf250]